MEEIITIIIVLVIGVGGYFLFFSGDTWTGTYYPNGCLSCEDQYINSPEFENLDTCLGWGRELKLSRNNPNDTFECGSNCERDEDLGGIFVCDETVGG